jgi:hypothetical protein
MGCETCMKRLSSLSNNRLKLGFIDPDTKHEFNSTYPTFLSLVQHVKSYREINRLPMIGNLELLIEMYLCELEENKAFVVDRNDSVPITLLQYVSGAGSFLSMIKAKCTGEDCLVADELAERRAERCFKCRYNTNGLKDYTMLEKVSRALMSAVRGTGKTRYDRYLGQCLLCGCDLLTKVRLKRTMFTIDKHVKIRLPNNNVRDLDGKLLKCWQIDEDLLGDK